MTRAPSLRRSHQALGHQFPAALALPPDSKSRSCEVNAANRKSPRLRLLRGDVRAGGPLHQRLAAVAGDRSVKQVAAATGLNPETVRRYLRGQAPSAEFLAALCRAYGVNGHWLLTGEGAAFLHDSSADALRRSSASALLRTLADRLELG